MSHALEGQYYCKNHQGNHSHYADHNCDLCKALTKLTMIRRIAGGDWGINPNTSMQEIFKLAISEFTLAEVSEPIVTTIQLRCIECGEKNEVDSNTTAYVCEKCARIREESK